MDSLGKLEDHRKEIRSLLLPFQKDYSSRTAPEVPPVLNSSNVRIQTTKISTEVPSAFNSDVIRNQTAGILTPEVPTRFYSECCRSKIPTPEVQPNFYSDYLRSKIQTPKVPSTINSSCFIENQTLSPSFISNIRSEITRMAIPKVPSTSNFDYIRNQSGYERNVPNSLRKKLQKVAERLTNGIYVEDFPDYFEKETSECLDFHSLGYGCLSDFLDAVPDIFIRKPVNGSKKHYGVHSAKSQFNDSSLLERIALKMKNILEHFQIGIMLKDILLIYNVNCKDTLCIEDLGFDDLEAFVCSIKTFIPSLRFGLIDGEKSVHLKPNYTPGNSCIEPGTLENGTIPFDAVTNECTLKPLTLPVDFDHTKFTPVHVSAVLHPGRLYIQLSGEAIQNFVELSKNIDSLYDGSQSQLYMMKSRHIKEGALCAAKWPTDNHWYRAHILSIPSMETVKVNYIDYGTSDTIPTSLLRYLKKEHVDLPVQCLRCRLSFLKPPRNAENWDAEVKLRILDLCFDVPLMAKFEKGSDGIYSIVLCDTNGIDDVYINDILCDESLAEYVVDADRNSPEPEMQLENFPNFNILQALQAQYFLKSFAAVAQPFVQNEHFKILLRQVSMYCQTTDTVQQNIDMPFMPPVETGFTSFPLNMNERATERICNAYSTGARTLGRASIRTSAHCTSPTINTADHFNKTHVEKKSLKFPKLNSTMGNGEYKCPTQKLMELRRFFVGLTPSETGPSNG